MTTLNIFYSRTTDFNQTWNKASLGNGNLWCVSFNEGSRSLQGEIWQTCNKHIQGSYARTKLNRIRNRFQILQNHNRENNSPVDEQWGRDREISKTKGKILHRVLG